MKKLLTFTFIAIICLFATPVFADDTYKGTCTCLVGGDIITQGTCDPNRGCICGGQIFENSCVKQNTNNNTNNNSNTGNNNSNTGTNNNFNVGSSNVDCGVIADITRPAVRLIMIAAPIILIVMGGVDILKVVTSSDEKDMKKAWSNLIKRFIICAVIFLLPLLVNFIIGWTTFKDLTACL